MQTRGPVLRSFAVPRIKRSLETVCANQYKGDRKLELTLPSPTSSASQSARLPNSRSPGFARIYQQSVLNWLSRESDYYGLPDGCRPRQLQIVLKAPSLQTRLKMTQILIWLEYSNHCCNEENFIPWYIVKKGWNSDIVIIIQGAEKLFLEEEKHCVALFELNSVRILSVQNLECKAVSNGHSLYLVFVWLLGPVICNSFCFWLFDEVYRQENLKVFIFLSGELSNWID